MSKEALEAAKARKKAAQEADGTVPLGASAKIEADKPFLPLYAFAGFAAAVVVSLIVKKWKSK